MAVVLGDKIGRVKPCGDNRRQKRNHTARVRKVVISENVFKQMASRNISYAARLAR